MKTDLFQSCGHCWVFQTCWHIECSTFTASSFRIWNSSTGIPSPPLAFFTVMLSKAHLTSHSSMSGLGEWSHHRDYLGREALFCPVLTLASWPVDRFLKRRNLDQVVWYSHLFQNFPQDWKRSVFIPIPKKGNAKECSNYHTIVLISHGSKVRLKILQARLQQ